MATLKQFIKDNRQELDKRIAQAISNQAHACSNPYGHRFHNDAERRLWILNDNSLYEWARSEGVKI